MGAHAWSSACCLVARSSSARRWRSFHTQGLDQRTSQQGGMGSFVGVEQPCWGTRSIDRCWRSSIVSTFIDHMTRAAVRWQRAIDSSRRRTAASATSTLACAALTCSLARSPALISFQRLSRAWSSKILRSAARQRLCGTSEYAGPSVATAESSFGLHS